MTTYTIQIGNTDNKLSQNFWSNFCKSIHSELIRDYVQLHFVGGSHFDAPWQNACFVFNCSDDKIKNLKKTISEIGKNYYQESIAFTKGSTEFI
jgi:hypothetical protein